MKLSELFSRALKKRPQNCQLNGPWWKFWEGRLRFPISIWDVCWIRRFLAKRFFELGGEWIEHVVFVMQTRWCKKRWLPHSESTPSEFSIFKYTGPAKKRPGVFSLDHFPFKTPSTEFSFTLDHTNARTTFLAAFSTLYGKSWRIGRHFQLFRWQLLIEAFYNLLTSHYIWLHKRPIRVALWVVLTCRIDIQ